MTLPVDFADAHRPHSGDSEHLFAGEGLENADQFYRLGVDCGLKAVMEQLGMPVAPSRLPPAEIG